MSDNKIQLVTDNVDVFYESKFKELNSRGFVRANNELHQWYLLVNEGWSKVNIPKNEIVSTYLVTMLNRFTNRVDLFDQLKAFNFAEYLFQGKKIDEPCTQDVADLCLQFVSYFPKQTKNRYQMKSYDYVVDLGVGLYKDLSTKSEGKDDWYSNAFPVMAESFGEAIMVLRSTYSNVVTEVENLSHSGMQEAVLFLNDTEAMKVKRVLDNLHQMYLEPKNNHSSKKQQ